MKKRIHLIGIGGSGLSAIARLLLESGYPVSGSDRQESDLTGQLQAAGARIAIGHQAENVRGAGLVLRSSAIPDENAEVQAARAAGIPVLKRGEFLGELLKGRRCVAVAGTHGKTTTTAMIAWVLTALDQEPSFLIGGIARNLGTNARAGRGPIFVIEADEYDRMFLGLSPQAAVVTNVEHDHADCFPTARDFQQAFEAFTDRLAEGGFLLACSDDAGSARLLERAHARGQKALAYGLRRWPAWAGPHYEGRGLRLNPGGGCEFEAWWGAELLVRLSLQVPGEHNAANALAALAVAHQLGLPLESAARALSEYAGTGRRFEVRGQAAGVTVIDDYAHHPTEIRATLAAARDRFPSGRVWAVWQPHTYSRTRALYGQFLTAFAQADHVLVMEVYAAREAVEADFSSRQLAEAMKHPDAHFAPDLDAAREWLVQRLRPGDVLLVLSAGDADRLSGEVLEALTPEGRAEHAR